MKFPFLELFKKKDAANDGPEVEICRDLYLGYIKRVEAISLLRRERDHRQAFHAEREMFRRH